MFVGREKSGLDSLSYPMFARHKDENSDCLRALSLGGSRIDQLTTEQTKEIKSLSVLRA